MTSAVHESPLTAFSLGRTYLWSGAIEAWRSHPWFGLGAGVFQFLVPDYTGGRFDRGELHAHNGLLAVLSETGLCGLLACVCMLWALWAPLLRNPAERGWALIWLLFLLGLNVFDFYPLFYPFSCMRPWRWRCCTPTTLSSTAHRNPGCHEAVPALGSASRLEPAMPSRACALRPSLRAAYACCRRGRDALGCSSRARSVSRMQRNAWPSPKGLRHATERASRRSAALRRASWSRPWGVPPRRSAGSPAARCWYAAPGICAAGCRLLPGCRHCRS